ncbi:hypothetical protein KI387_001210, partial [Taxus chinensis]
MDCSERDLGLSFDYNYGSDVISQNALLASLEFHVENFDASDEEEDLKNLAGKEELIKKLMKSLEVEISSPECLIWEMAADSVSNSCWLQSDSAVSMSSSTSTVSDPYSLNLGNECRCSRHDEDDEGMFGFLQHGLVEIPDFHGSDIRDQDDILE